MPKSRHGAAGTSLTMSKTLTYLDTGILFAAWRGIYAAQALHIINDPAREFVGSDFLKLETMPKAVYGKNVREQNFYRAYFQLTAIWVYASKPLFNHAYREACTLGLAGFDAYHLAAALSVGTVEFITTENATKPLFRSRQIAVRHYLAV